MSTMKFIYTSFIFHKYDTPSCKKKQQPMNENKNPENTPKNVFNSG
jgi:hypothetical protein